jgi:hypothetical protein
MIKKVWIDIHEDKIVSATERIDKENFYNPVEIEIETEGEFRPGNPDFDFFFNLIGWYYIDGQLVFKPEDIEFNNQKILEEEFKFMRQNLLDAFTKWATNVAIGVEVTDPSIITWRQDLLDMNLEAFEIIPEKIQYYLT